VAGFPLPRHMWPFFLGLLYYFSYKSRKHYWIEKHLKQNRFTRHFPRNTKILRFIESNINLSNSPSKKQGPIWPWPWELGLNTYVVSPDIQHINPQNPTECRVHLSKPHAMDILISWLKHQRAKISCYGHFKRRKMFR
jgi:hypothetical protein